jgi:ketosteroid isomerase-like protein
MNSDEPEALKLVMRVQQCWNTHDLDGLLSCFAADYESIHPCHPERNFKGQVAMRASWGAMFKYLPDFQAGLGRCAVMGSTAWTEWCWQGTHVNGGVYEAAGVMIFEVADGLIVRAQVYSDVLPHDELDWDEVLTDLLGSQNEPLDET